MVATQAKIRYESVVKPTLQNQGFTQIKGNGYNMINPKTNQIVMVTSAPTNRKLIPATKSLITRYRKEYETPSITYLFTRDVSDYPQASKGSYMKILNKICSMNLLNGVATGISTLPVVVTKLQNNEQFRLIA